MYIVAFITGLMLFSAAVVVYSIVSGTDKGPEDMTKVDSYVSPKHGQPICMAISPECGECFGEVINGSCYVNEDELSDSERQAMGL